MVSRNSAAFIILVAVVAFITTGFVFTMVSKPWSALLASDLFTFETQWGKDWATWQQGIYDWAMLFSLLAILFYAFIKSRRATT